MIFEGTKKSIFFGLGLTRAGFDIPQTVLDNKKCDLSIALLIFYRADGLSYLEDKTDNANLPQWYSFIKRLYDSILTGEYQSG